MKVNKIYCQPLRPFVPSFKNTEEQKPENNAANPGFKGLVKDVFQLVEKKLEDPLGPTKKE